MLLVRVILNIIDNPSLNVSGGWTSYLFYGVGLVAAVIVFFASDSDGCLVPVLIGAAVSAIVIVVLQLVGAVILYVFALLILTVLLAFSVPILFEVSKNRTKIKTITNPGFEELTLEPLYFAFNNEKKFDSSLNGAVNVSSTSLWKEDVRKRWTMLLILIGCTIVFSLFGRLLPESRRMDRFDNVFRKTDNTEIIQYDELQPL